MRRDRSSASVSSKLALASIVLALSLPPAACGPNQSQPVEVLRFWAMGREGEVVAQLATEFEKQNPHTRVEVQQIPWSAAHEKMLTAYVGRSTPDVAQLGNTWIAEFVALQALMPLDTSIAESRTIHPEAFFHGIWDTNVIDDIPYGVPWYVDTRVLFYRRDLLARAGYDRMPDTWPEWLEALTALKKQLGPDRYPIFLPMNEWPPLVILGLQNGSPLLTDEQTRGGFRQPAFREAFLFYLGLFEKGLAPPVGNNEVANIYQEFARGYFTMLITGPWNLGEFRDRLPEELQDAWATAPLPGPDADHPGLSLAGGSSLVVFKDSAHTDLAFKLVEFLSEPAQQLRFYELTGDLPARVEAWRDSRFSGDPRIRAFEEQLLNVVPSPKIPEWEQIATRVQFCAELAVRGAAAPDSALALLDREVTSILAKRRWLLDHGLLGQAHSGAVTQ